MARYSTRSARRRKSLRGGQQVRLTSMMDILTTLLLFLLKSFVLEGEVLNPVPGVNLPQSTSEAAAQPSVTIAIFGDAVMMDGEMVASIKDATADRDLVIPGLAERLDHARAQAEEIARLRGSDEPFLGRVAIQGDRDINFSILQRVMYTCSSSGYESISLAVIGPS